MYLILVLIGIIFHSRQVKAQEHEGSQNVILSENFQSKTKLNCSRHKRGEAGQGLSNQNHAQSAEAEKQCASSSKKLHKSPTEPEPTQSVGPSCSSAAGLKTDCVLPADKLIRLLHNDLLAKICVDWLWASCKNHLHKQTGTTNNKNFTFTKIGVNNIHE